jgi:hypothetical protein
MAAAAAWGALRARLADAAAGRPWDDGVPGPWITGDRILDAAALPLAWAFGFVLLRNLLVHFVFAVRSSGAWG